MNSQNERPDETPFSQHNYEKYCLDCLNRAGFDCLTIRGTCDYGHALCTFRPRLKRSVSNDKQGKLL